jgi:hypothetical protein
MGLTGRVRWRQPAINASSDPSALAVIPGRDPSSPGFDPSSPGFDPGIKASTVRRLVPGSSPGMTMMTIKAPGMTMMTIKAPGMTIKAPGMT